jgi:hypothetical protein
VYFGLRRLRAWIQRDPLSRIPTDVYVCKVVLSIKYFLYITQQTNTVNVASIQNGFTLTMICGSPLFPGSRARPVCRAENLPSSVSLFSRQCGILNFSQPYRPPRPVTAIALLYFTLLYFILLYFTLIYFMLLRQWCWNCQRVAERFLGR